MLAETPTFEDTGDRLPTQEEFEALAKSDPVKLLEACLTRYQREVNDGITATLKKRARPRRSQTAEGATRRNDPVVGQR